MKSWINWRLVLILFLIFVGISGVIEALPHTSETPRDLAIDAGLLFLIIAVSGVLANIRTARRNRKKSGV